jgi:hypothetical protein
MTGVIMRASNSLSRTLPLMALLLGCGSSGSTSQPDAADMADAAVGGEGGSTGGSGGTGTVRGGSGGSRDAGLRPDSSSGGTGPVDTGGAGGDGGSAGEGGQGGGTGGVVGTGGTGGTVGTGGTGGTTGGGGTGGAGGVSGMGTCVKPVPIPMGAHAEVTVSNVGAAHALDLPCGPNSGTVVLSFTLSQRELVYADTFGANWNTILYFSSSCALTPGTPDAGTSQCSDDECGTQQSQAVAILGYGQHFLILSGAAGATGTATVHFQHAPIGNGPLSLLGAGMSTRTGTTGGIGLMNTCEAAGADDSYWWRTCPDYAGGAFKASTCNGAAFDTVLSLQVPRGDLISCSDDDPNCGRQSTLNATIPAGPGINVINVDSSTMSNAGAYSVAITRP